MENNYPDQLEKILDEAIHKTVKLADEYGIDHDNALEHMTFMMAARIKMVEDME